MSQDLLFLPPPTFFFNVFVVSATRASSLDGMYTSFSLSLLGRAQAAQPSTKTLPRPQNLPMYHARCSTYNITFLRWIAFSLPDYQNRAASHS